MTPAERIAALADQMGDEPSAQGVLTCLAGMMASGDTNSVKLLAAVSARFAAASMFAMGITRDHAEQIGDEG